MYSYGFKGVELVFAATIISLYIFIKYREKFMLYYFLSFSLFLFIAFAFSEFTYRYKIVLIIIFTIAPMVFGYREGDKMIAKYKSINQILFRSKSDYIFVFSLLICILIFMLLFWK